LRVCSSNAVRYGPNCGPYRARRSPTSTGDACETTSATSASRTCPQTKTSRRGNHFSLIPRS
jgi:hypothetical protein